MLSLILFSVVILCTEFSQGNPSLPHDEKYHSLVADDAIDRNHIQLLIEAQVTNTLKSNLCFQLYLFKLDK